MKRPENWREQALPTRFWLSIILSLLLILLGSGCARKGPLKPKLQSLPEAPQELTILQRGEGFLLGWSLPTRNLDGSPAEDLTGFRILRMSYAAEEGCSSCRQPDEIRASIDIAYPATAQRIGNRFYWRDQQLTIGRGYRYLIQPLTVGGRSGAGADIRQVLLLPPPAPDRLQATTEDEVVRVTWQQPPLDTGMKLLGYQVYRRRDDTPFPFIPLNSEPLQTTELVDENPLDSHSYEYRIGTLVEVGEVRLESTPSTTLQVSLPAR